MKANSSNKDIEQIINETVSGASLPKKRSREDVWKNMEVEMKKTKSISSRKPIFYAAASIAVLIMCFAAIQFSKVELSTQLAEHKETVLPDGSTVRLNAASVLTYNKIYWLFERKLKLEGEAFFEVEKGKQFVVNTKLGKVKVLGTKFNVFARDKRFEVKCESGRVEVRRKQNRVEIGKGEASILNASQQKMEKKAFEVEEVEWFNGRFVYNKALLENVFEEMERQFSVKIDYDKSLNNRVFSGEINSDNLENALKIVCIPMNLEYSIQKDMIQINRR